MNRELREKMQTNGVRQWEVAEALGISEFHFSRKLRHELPDDLRGKALAAVEEIAKTHEGAANGKA